MKTIWKYEIPLEDTFSLSMPEGAQVLTVQLQGGIPSLWAMVEPSAPQEERRFAVIGTGNPIGEVGDYIATIQLHGGELVFHVFHGARLEH